MARADTAGASASGESPASRLFFRHRQGTTGHAGLIANPAYEKLVAAEPILRNCIPILIVLFLIIVAIARVIQLYDLRIERENRARDLMAMVATISATDLEKAEPSLPADDFQAAVQNQLDSIVGQYRGVEGQQVYVSDPTGKLIAASPQMLPGDNRDFTEIVHGAQPLVIFGIRAGVLDVTLDGDQPALATLRNVGGRIGSVAIVAPLSAIYSDWRADVSLNVSVFVGTSAILLVILFGYFSQSARALEADQIYQETYDRFDTALRRGRCGLWDWDVARGRLFWSKSMFELVGMKPRDGLLGFREVNGLIHPEDGDLMNLVEALYDANETTVDRMFRMQKVGGGYVWLRIRVELVDADGAEPHLIGIAVDVTEQMRLAESSRTADIRLRDAIETISEAFVLWDAENRLVMCNSKYQQLHGISDEATVPGTPYADVIAAGDQPLVRSAIPVEGPAEQGSRSFEAQLNDGRWLQINERRTKDGGFVSVGTDITTIKRHEEKLIEGERRQMATIADLRLSRQKLEHQAREMVELAQKYSQEKDRAEAASRIKSEFMANISHELRTPLNAVIGFSEIMQAGLFGPLGSPKYTEYCKDINESGNFLLNVINDILDMARIESGRLALDMEPLALDELIDEAIRVITPDAEHRRITIEAFVKPETHVRADRRAVKQMVLNLLSNAVKFTPPAGRITIRARRLGDALSLSIIDSGIGIPKEALKKLGRPFEQVQNQFTKSHKGSGLGLAITRSLAELHGGAMRIRSIEGKGTIVSIRLPLRRAELAGRPAGPAFGAPHDAGGSYDAALRLGAAGGPSL